MTDRSLHGSRILIATKRHFFFDLAEPLVLTVHQSPRYSYRPSVQAVDAAQGEEGPLRQHSFLPPLFLLALGEAAGAGVGDSKEM